MGDNEWHASLICKIGFATAWIGLGLVCGSDALTGAGGGYDTLASCAMLGVGVFLIVTGILICIFTIEGPGSAGVADC